MLLPKLLFALGIIAVAPGNSATDAFQLKDAAEYEVKRDLLEEAYPAYKSFHGAMHSGLIPAALKDDKSSADGDFSSYFFWLFRPDAESVSDAEEPTDESFRNDTLVIWFNGGPGCSSLMGLMAEMGPVGIQKFRPGIDPSENPATAMDAPLVANEFAWTKKSAMLFVEQPAGVGFSTASSEWAGEENEKRTEADVASAFYAFLQNLYTVFGDDLLEKKLYLTGESYAGMYIPSIGREINRQNKLVLSKDEENRSPSLPVINLYGAAIGNGLIDAAIQWPSSIDFAWWHGMIDLQTYRSLHEKWNKCANDQILDSASKPFHPFTTPNECGIQNAIMEASGNKFLYEVTTNDVYASALVDGGAVHRFFNDPIVRESINAPSFQDYPHWLTCVPGSGRRRRLSEGTDHDSSRKLTYMQNDKPLSVVSYIAELLDDAKLDILMYNGDFDLVCNAQGTEMSLESMAWSGQKDGWTQLLRSGWIGLLTINRQGT